DLVSGPGALGQFRLRLGQFAGLSLELQSHLVDGLLESVEAGLEILQIVRRPPVPDSNVVIGPGDVALGPLELRLAGEQIDVALKLRNPAALISQFALALTQLFPGILPLLVEFGQLLPVLLPLDLAELVVELRRLEF